MNIAAPRPEALLTLHRARERDKRLGGRDGEKRLEMPAELQYSSQVVANSAHIGPRRRGRTQHRYSTLSLERVAWSSFTACFGSCSCGRVRRQQSALSSFAVAGENYYVTFDETPPLSRLDILGERSRHEPGGG